MSDIPKSERSESRLEAQHKAYKIRKMITAELMASFAYSQKKQEKHIKAMTEHIKNEEERKATAQKIRELEEDFDTWFICNCRVAPCGAVQDLRGRCLTLLR